MKRFRTRIFFYFLTAGLIIVFAGVAYAVPPVRDGLTLLQCKVYGNKNAQAECVFSLIKKQMLKNGIGPALDMFLVASALYPRGLDIDCHAGIHRLGDMAYYNLFYNDPSLVDFPFPEETNICNRGFYHGIFEHLFQDRPDPAFIAATCNRLRQNPFIDAEAVSGTCFHASGHGLFRAQSERVPTSQWGMPSAFVDAPAAVCASMAGVEAKDRYDCTTGVESIFIQSSLLGDYGLSNPDPWNPLKVCDQLEEKLHPTCYYVRSLMVAQIDGGYEDMLDNCYFSSDALFGSCLRGIITGLFVNGTNETSYQESLDLCADTKVEQRGFSKFCYEKLVGQLNFEYWEDFTPECAAFPEAYRPLCDLKKRN
jgi:hypothetical protein